MTDSRQFDVTDGAPQQSLGTHCLLDLVGCGDPRLDDPEALATLLAEAATAAHATVLSTHHHRFDPHGVSAMCVLAESHISIHTWPEFGSASVDVYTCGPLCEPRLACDWIIDELMPARHVLQVVKRGVMPGSSSLEPIGLADQP